VNQNREIPRMKLCSFGFLLFRHHLEICFETKCERRRRLCLIKVGGKGTVT
jgi:hypothetical protein